MHERLEEEWMSGAAVGGRVVMTEWSVDGRLVSHHGLYASSCGRLNGCTVVYVVFAATRCTSLCGVYERPISAIVAPSSTIVVVFIGK